MALNLLGFQPFHRRLLAENANEIRVKEERFQALFSRKKRQKKLGDRRDVTQIVGGERVATFPQC